MIYDPGGFDTMMKKQHYFRSNYANRVYPETDQLWDHTLFESHSFAAIPSLGSLVEGWLLVVPKFFALSVGSLHEDYHQELGQFLDDIVPRVQKKFGPVSIFEHGPAIQSTHIGCGVDYAHLHLVPTDCDLLKSVQKRISQIAWRRVTGLCDTKKAFRVGSPYYFLQQPFGAGQAYLGVGSELPSQLFRRIIADHLGYPERYDWKHFEGIENISATVTALADNIQAELSQLAVP